MATVALFHPSFGITPGVRDAERRLTEAGHEVRVVDYYGDGSVFHDYDAANEYVNSVGFPALMRRAVDEVHDLPDGFVAMGFSNGAGMATYVALNRRVSAAILCSGALPLENIGANAWPKGVPAQLHRTAGDPRRMKGSVEAVMASVNAAGAMAEYLRYPGSGHLFTDPSLADEYDAAATEAFWVHVLRFCGAPSRVVA